MANNQYAQVDPSDYSDALDRLSQMATGNSAINTHPGLMNALASGNATPLQAGEINQFVSGVKAQNMYHLALATGGKINFTTDERGAMDAMGFDYSKVDALATNNQQATLDALKQRGLTATINPDGTLATDAQGNLITRQAPVAQPAQPQSGGGHGWSLGRVWHDATHNPVMNTMAEGLNLAQAEVSQVATGVQRQWDDLTGGGLASLNASSTQQEMDKQRRIEMRAMGYNPDSVWSSLAFDSKGYAKTDLAPAIREWDNSNAKDAFGKSGIDMLPDVLQFLRDPKTFQDSIVADSSLTPEQAAQKIAMVNDPNFVKFAARVASSQLTVGNVGAQHQGLDPVANSRIYHLTAASTDLVASFLIDPTIIGGKIFAAVRKAPTIIDSMYDVEGIVKQLDPAMAGPLSARRSIQNGWQSMIDSTNDIRDGLQVGDKAKVAAAYASIRAKTPALEPLIGDFLGTAQAQWRVNAEGVTGLSDHIFTNGVGEAVTNLAEAVNYVKDKAGLIRLAGGKAAVESSYMPGAVSNYGFRALKANAAAHLAARDVARTAAQDAEYLSARNAGTLSSEDQAISDAAISRADPAVPTRMIDLSKIAKFLPTAIDGIDMKSGLVVAAPDVQFIGQHVDAVKDALAGVRDAQKAAQKATKGLEDGELSPFGVVDGLRQAGVNVKNAKEDLASAIRAAEARAPKSGDFSSALLPAERGQVAYNIRRFGSATSPEEGGLHAGGWASPTAVAARARLAVTRMSTLLPRNTDFELGDAGTADKIYKYARFYLGKGSASSLAAQFANGDYAARKAIVEGLWDQVAHAAGMSRTSSGTELMNNVRTMDQAYTHAGPGWLIDGQPVALHEGQTVSTLHLPAFKTVHNAAANIGVYENTFGRLATSAPVDFMANMFRFGILAAPKTAYRNIIEPYAKAALDGQFGDVARTRALTYMSSEQLAKLGKSLGVDELKGTIPDNVIQMARQHLQDTIANGTKREQAVAKFTLKRVEQGDLATMAGFGRTRVGSSISDYGSRIAGYYRHALASTIPEQELKHADEIYEVIPNAALHFGQQIVAESYDPYGAKAVRDISETGLSPRALNYNLSSGTHPLLEGHGEGGQNTVYRRTGFSPQTTDRTVGTSRYINALAQRTHDAPEVSKAVMGVLRDPEGDLKPVIEALDARKGPRMTAYGKYFKPNEEDAQAIRALTPDEINLGKKQWAQDVVNDFKYLLTNENGQLNSKIADHIAEHGSAPDEVWFNENVAHNEIPRSVLAPEYTATPIGGIHNLATVLNDLSGKAFNQIVEGPIKRQSSMPFLATHYLKARAEQDAAGILDRLVDHGLERDAADELLKGQAVRQAYIRTEQMIDDPGLKTQFDVVARNLFMFPRAMQAFVRRWGGSLQRDPFKARKMILSLEASEHSGMVYRDENGELTFTYPGSQVMREAMAALGHLPGFSGIAKFPVGMDMTGKVMLAAPGFDQPFRFSLSPMINIPMRAIFAAMPEHQSIWTEIDTALNGQIGQGRGALQSVEPTFIQKLLSATNSDERNSQFASAFKAAYAHLYAAGYVPDPSAPPEVQDEFNNRLKTQVRNQLYWRFAFGLFAPAPPSTLQENVNQSDAKVGFDGTHSDYSFNLLGIKNLSAEYKHILDAANGDVARAAQIFTTLHPEGLAYTVSTTGTGVNKAFLPASTESLNWMEGHLDFLNQYKSVGSYFMPKTQGDFDLNAYHAQVAMGLRQNKSTSEFYQDVQTMFGSNVYYKQYDAYQAMKAQAIASGNPEQAKVLASAFQDWKTQFLNQNLFLKGKFAESTTGKIKSDAQLHDLQSMVDKNKVPDGLGPQLGQMLTIWRDYSDWKTQQSGSSTTNSATRQAAQDWVSQKLSGIAQQDPRLLNIYNAVFRGIDSSLSKVG